MVRETDLARRDPSGLTGPKKLQHKQTKDGSYRMFSDVRLDATIKI